MTLLAELCAAVDALGAAKAEWDCLAVAAKRPFSAPAWALAWWGSMRPRRGQLSLALVRDGEELAGILPLYRQGRTLRPLGGGLAPVEPLARPGREAAVAEAAAGLLAGSRSRIAGIELEAHSSSPAWTEMLAAAWPGRGGGWRWPRMDEPLPRIDFGEGFDAWLGARSSSFRREMRKKRRRLEQVGGMFRWSEGEALERDVGAFMRLHRTRLATKGGTSLGSETVETMLTAVGAELKPSGRFRLLMLELDGEPIAAQLLLAAGSEVSAWNTGFDQAQAKLSPVMLCLMEAIRDAAERGERTMSLGPGAQSYKYRLCREEEQDRLRSEVFVPHGRGYPGARLRYAPAQFRSSAAVRRLLRRPRPQPPVGAATR